MKTGHLLIDQSSGRRAAYVARYGRSAETMYKPGKVREPSPNSIHKLGKKSLMGRCIREGVFTRPRGRGQKSRSTIPRTPKGAGAGAVSIIGIP